MAKIWPFHLRINTPGHKISPKENVSPVKMFPKHCWWYLVFAFLRFGLQITTVLDIEGTLWNLSEKGSFKAIIYAWGNTCHKLIDIFFGGRHKRSKPSRFLDQYTEKTSNSEQSDDEFFTAGINSSYHATEWPFPIQSPLILRAH